MENANKGTHKLVQIQLRGAGEIKNFFCNNLKFEIGDKVIVEADRGLEIW